MVEHNCLSEVACMWKPRRDSKKRKGLSREGFEPNTFDHIKTASQSFDNSGVQLLPIIVKGFLKRAKFKQLVNFVERQATISCNALCGDAVPRKDKRLKIRDGSISGSLSQPAGQRFCCELWIKRKSQM